MQKDEFDFSDPNEDRIEYEKRTGLKWEDRHSEEKTTKISPFSQLYKKFVDAAFNALIFFWLIVGLITAGYWLYILYSDGIGLTVAPVGRLG